MELEFIKEKHKNQQNYWKPGIASTSCTLFNTAKENGKQGEIEKDREREREIETDVKKNACNVF